MSLNEPIKMDDERGFPVISQTLVNCDSHGILMIDHSDTVMIYSKVAEDLIGIPSSKVLHHSMEVLPRSLREVVRDIRAGGTTILEREITFTDQQDSEVRRAIRAEKVVTSSDSPERLLLVIKDLGALALLEEKMRKLEKLASIGTLTASMAHEIKNAIQPVNTFVDTLIKKANLSHLLQEPDEQKLMDLASGELKRIKNLLANMLRFAGPNRSTFAPVEIHSILQQTLALVRYQLEGRKIDLDLDLNGENDKIVGDAYQLEQAFLNITLNAIEAMSPGGKLTLKMRNVQKKVSEGTRNELEIIFTDTGIGFSPAMAARLFDTFYTTKQNGTGLGLSITRRIIMEHKGDITVESEENSGTKVIVSLPLNSP